MGGFIVQNLRDSPSTSCDGFLARPAVPDPNGVSLDGVLSAESADVSCVLRNFDLLHLLTEGGTVANLYRQYLLSRNMARA